MFSSLRVAMEINPNDKLKSKNIRSISLFTWEYFIHFRKLHFMFLKPLQTIRLW
jgi:hypothetical protein